ncbi:MAG: bifunctional alpha,alpha-trehalose-phosphate synthase (UDP-forming)/trehalose-phosphatase [Planctomycetota bacterium]
MLVVSNRLPYTLRRGAEGAEWVRSPGGLASALDTVLCERGGTWIGGRTGGAEGASEPPAPYRVLPVELSAGEVRRYYRGFSNRTLWPLFHSFVDRSGFERRDWEAYESVNLRFAAATADACRGRGLAWIHDYHLMRVPLHLRTVRPDARIAFFLHIPFPPPDLFRLLPWDRKLLRGLLACDLVGFHVKSYARNFLDCVEQLLGAPVDRRRGLVIHGDRTVEVGHFPLGVDFDLFEERARQAPAGAPQHRERVVLGVDRLDYTKGIPERILAIERLLELHPEYRGEVVFLQIAVPSRVQVAEYRDLKREIEQEVGRVNGRFSTADWSPIRYLYRSFPPEHLAALYRDADVALVTPLRDGMNLVAKEFVSCQVAEPGVLVLSRLAGAAETMREALLVNPYNIDETTAAVHRALVMDDPERRSRLLVLRRRERRHNVHAWAKRLLSRAAALPAGPVLPTDDDFENWLGDFVHGHRVALFLDYDGTLSPREDRPELATLSPEMRQALKTCAEHPRIDVAVISGRSLDDIRSMLTVPGIAYAGNHGLEICLPGRRVFRHQDLPHFAEKISKVAVALEAATREGAWVEDKGATLTFHYRLVPEERRRELAQRAREIIHEFGLIARDAHDAVEARPPIAWDKSHAVLRLLRGLHGRDWVETVRTIYVGDDETDEDAFRVLDGLGISFRIGSARTATAATYRLPGPEALRSLLLWLVRREPERHRPHPRPAAFDSGRVRR